MSNFAERLPTRRDRRRQGETAAMEELKTLEPDHDERGQVESWRLHILIEAGYPLPLAERIASSQADLQRPSSSSGRG